MSKNEILALNKRPETQKLMHIIEQLKAVIGQDENLMYVGTVIFRKNSQ